ncbi:hypothetical protein Cgig2_016989 [Carnegiea gigantea]|uniref:Uncharacterized protein n=1 Tax=Carnegiea gigantea TaxID=171969 RepID=A0A9Q1QJ78_9CARY|nr:hypothetical protein Cgig2_016989 [Carnegiea gigantea]
MAISSSTLKAIITVSLSPNKPSISTPQFTFPVSVTCKPTNLTPSLSPISLSRRVLLPSASSIWDALTGGGGGNSAREAVQAIRRGMLLFRKGDVKGSLAEFDKAIALDPRQKACRFEEGAEQFRMDVAQNPNDTEESIWCFLCEAQLYGVDEARKRFLEASVQPFGIWYFL